MANVNYPPQYIAPEVWQIIFRKLERNKLDTDNLLHCDLYSCYRTCTRFQNILRPSKLIWLFSPIVPLIVPYITGRDLLQFRLICKSWKAAVDNYLENSDALRDSKEIRRRQLQPSNFILCSFSTPRKIAKYVSMMQDHAGNPFPGRTVEVYCIFPLNRQYQEAFWNIHVMVLLSRFGHCIHHLRLDLRFEVGTIPSLKALLVHTPNLRSICLKGRVITICHSEFTEDFPPLRNISSICLQKSEVVDGTALIFPASLQLYIASRFMANLKRLQISFADIPEFTSSLKKLHLPNLEILVISISHEAQLGLIFPMTKHNYRLKSISIALEETEPGTIYTLANLLKPLKNLKWCLQQLVIITNSLTVMALVKQSDLEFLTVFEQLQHLTLQGFDLGSLVFLRYLPKSLKCLELNSSSHEDWTGWLGDVLAYELPVIRKSVWRSLPRLQNFIVFDSDRNCRHNFSKQFDIFSGLLKNTEKRVKGHIIADSEYENGDFKTCEIILSCILMFCILVYLTLFALILYFV